MTKKLVGTYNLCILFVLIDIFDWYLLNWKLRIHA